MNYYKNKKFSFTFLIVIAIFIMGGCSNADHRASFSSNDNSATISIDLSSAHPFLAEYDRFLVLSRQGKEIAKQKLFPDSGGYSASNLYMCNLSLYRLKGYFDEWVIDLNAGTIVKGACTEDEQEYVGIFHGGGSAPWKFYSSSERIEKKLEPKGG